MYPELNCHLVRLPELLQQNGTGNVAGQALDFWSPAKGANLQLAVSFETLLEELSGLPRLFVELDGSIMWAGGEGSSAWRIDGMVFDKGDSVQWIEIKGTCPSATWQELLHRLRQLTGHDLLALCLPQMVFVRSEDLCQIWK